MNHLKPYAAHRFRQGQGQLITLLGIEIGIVSDDEYKSACSLISRLGCRAFILGEDRPSRGSLNGKETGK
jgi:hypothetical protein